MTNQFTALDMILVGFVCALAGAYATLGPGASAHAHESAPDPALLATLKPDPVIAPRADSPEAAAHAFRQALHQGDSATALKYLDPRVTVFESGYIERGRAEYQAKHMVEDMAFLKTAKVTPLRQRVHQTDANCMIEAEFLIDSGSGLKRKRSLSLETLQLKPFDGQWRITHIHWSSRALPLK